MTTSRDEITVLVTGSREWTDVDSVVRALDFYLQRWPGMKLIVGDCATGADRIALRWAKQSGVPWRRFAAKWKELGKRAGPERNQRMVNAGPDVCLAFPLPGSHGTIDCMRRAYAAKIPVANVGKGLRGDALPLLL